MRPTGYNGTQSHDPTCRASLKLLGHGTQGPFRVARFDSTTKGETDMATGIGREEGRRRGGYERIARYGADHVASQAREGLVARELVKVRHPERLTPEELEALKRQVWVRQAALMREARVVKRAARAAEKTAQEAAAKVIQDAEDRQKAIRDAQAVVDALVAANRA